ncbi:hypothetical protein [Thermoflexus sp.]|uniref:hypothetical protein n=1 Tax=Thermoflexus sp. TaxID=1969742 RepID=UPI002ADE4CE5|nr:hypothetical protein [Thermoflexus sp.]
MKAIAALGLILALLLALALLFQSWAAAAQATAVLGAQMLSCFLGALIPLAFWAGFRMAGGRIRMPELPSIGKPIGLPDGHERPPVPARRIPPEVADIIREWWA